MNTILVRPQRQPLAGVVRVPGDKSVSHRALLFAAMSNGNVEISGLGTGEDNLRTRAIVSALGAGVEETGADSARVHGVGLNGFKPATHPLDCGNSGTSIRLLCGFLAGQSFQSELFGDESLSARPMRRVIDPLTLMGARISGRSGARTGEVYPPLVVVGSELTGIRYQSPVASAQVKSAILIAGLYAAGTTEVLEPGPSRDHTERMLSYLGAPLQWADQRARLTTDDWDHRLEPRPIVVPGDPSSAAFVLAAGLVAGASSLTLENICVNPTRIGFLDVLQAMGASIAIDGHEGDEQVEPVANLVVSGKQKALSGRVVGGDEIVRAIDELPILAVVAATASGVTEFRDAEELRVKESDRIQTTTSMLRAFGVEVEERPDGMIIQGQVGRRFRAARIDAAGDHRIAMSAAVAGLIADGEVRIDDAHNVMTSFPSFVPLLQELGADISTS